MRNGSGIDYKYLRIQGRKLAENTLYPKGVFSIGEELANSGKMDQEDKSLYEELDKWFYENLPFPPQCNNKEKVICFFKTENSNEMLKYINPLLWLLDKYEQPYYLVYTNFPGEIVYEDEYQVVAKVYEQVIEKVDKKITGK